MNRTLGQLNQFKRWPRGLWLFSRAVCFTAPYFKSIRPTFIKIEPGHAEAFMRKRRKVTNHLGTVHAIAMANLCEFVAGTLMEISVEPNMRWIPKAMHIRYLKKAETDLIAKCTIDNMGWQEAQDVVLSVHVYDRNDVEVAQADVPMYVSPKPK